jgi:hypothetical protein
MWYKKRVSRVLNCSETPARRIGDCGRTDEKGRVYSSPARAWKLVPGEEQEQVEQDGKKNSRSTGSIASSLTFGLFWKLYFLWFNMLDEKSNILFIK